MTWVFTSLIVSVVVIIACVLSVHYTASPDYTDNDLLYAPIDNRIVPFSNVFCQGLKLEVDVVQFGYAASLYMLDSPPKLARLEAFSFSDHLNYVGDTDYHYFYYYMYPGSNFSVRACISRNSGGPGFFYLIKGNSNFKTWQNDYYPLPDKKSYYIDELCSTTANATTHFYGIEEEDFYYLVFYTQHTPYALNVNMAFNRTLYQLPVNGSKPRDSCSIETSSSYSECSVNVPLSGQIAYLTVEPQTGTVIDWSDDGIGLVTSCVARAWVYVVIVIAVVMGLVVVIVPILVCVIVWLKKSNKAVTVNAAGTATDEAANVPLVSDPPANPYYQQPPPATYDATPPTYDATPPAYDATPPQYKA